MALLSVSRGPRTERTSPASNDVLLLLAGPNPSAVGEPSVAIARLAGDGGRFLLARARGHGLLPLVAHRLAALPPGVLPAAFRGRVLAARRAALARSLARVAVLGEVLEAFRRRGVAPLCFKGPALSARLHGDPSLRDGDDLDLLVLPREVPAARAALEARGFRRAGPLPDAALPAYLRAGCELPFARGDGAVVDLHWRLFPRCFGFPLEREGLREGARRVEVDGLPVEVPGDAHHLLLLAFHGGKSLWSRLGWVADLARFLALADAPDPVAVRRLAAATGAERALATGLLLAARLPGGGPPPGYGDPSGDREAVALAAHFGGRLAAGRPAAAGFRERLDLLLRLRERPADRWRLLLGLSLLPTPGEWARVARFPPLLPLLGGVRTVRAAARHGLRAARGVA